MTFTGASLKEVLETNIFTFFSILDASDAVIAEEALRNMKIIDNNLLLKNEKTKDRYSDLSNYYTNLYKEKGIKTWNIKADISGLMQLKQMIQGGGA